MMEGFSMCQKFEANIFNKAKCQHCFKPKELHTAAALQRNKDTRKISKCGYLFVAPDSLDFSSPVDRTRRWQRRFFVLFDDGELTYSLDENVNTVPQGVVDMNTCTEVVDAQETTSHQYSMAVICPDKRIHIKGTSSDQASRWFDVLVMYPRSSRPHHHRPSLISSQTTNGVRRSERRQRASCPPAPGNWEDLTVNKPTRVQLVQPSQPVVQPSQPPQPVVPLQPVQPSQLVQPSQPVQPSVRRSDPPDLVSTEPPVSPASVSGQHAPNKPLTLFETLVAEEKTKPVSRSGRYLRLAGIPNTKSIDQLDGEVSQRSRPRERRKSTALDELRGAGAGSVVSDTTRLWESRFSLDTPSLHADPTPSNPRDRIRRKLTQGTARSSSLPPRSNHSSAPGQDPAPRLTSPSPERPPTHRLSAPPLPLTNGHTKNETDESKMARGGEQLVSSKPRSTLHDGPLYVKKGWLVKQGAEEKVWNKHWFVLAGTRLSYYTEPHMEDTGPASGSVDLKTCTEVTECKKAKKYGFVLKFPGEEQLVLSAMTTGIRTNWLDAINRCMTSTEPRDRRSKRYMSSPAIPYDVAQREPAVERPKEEEIRETRRNRHTLTSCTWPYQPPGDSVEQGPESVSEKQDSKPATSRVAMEVKGRPRSSSDVVVSDVNTALQRSPEEEAALDDVEKNIRRIHRRSLPANRHKRDAVVSAPPITKSTTNPEPASTKHLRSLTDTAIKPSQDFSVSSARRKSDSRAPNHYKGPCAKMKDRSRAKSPRAKSPPPQQSLDVLIDSLVLASDVDIDISNEVPGLSSQLDSSVCSTHDSEMTDFSSPVQDPPPPHEPTYHLRRLSQEAVNVEAREELNQVQAKLNMAMSELAKSELGLASSADALREEEELNASLQSQVDELERQVRNMTSQMNNYENKLKGLHELEAQVTGLTRDLHLKSARLEEQDEELRSAKGQLRDMEEHQMLVQDEAVQATKQLEERFAEERERMEEEVEQLKRELELSSEYLESNMDDLMQEKERTIAEMEEELVENEKRMEELSDKVHQEVQEHGELLERHEALDKEYNMMRARYDEAQTDLVRCEEELRDSMVENHEVVQCKNEVDTRNSLLKTDLERVEEKFQQLQREHEELIEVKEDCDEEFRETKSALDAKDILCSELQRKLEEVNSQLEKMVVLYEETGRDSEKPLRSASSYQDQRLREVKEELESALGKKEAGEIEMQTLKRQLDEQQVQFEEALREKDASILELKELMQKYDSENNMLKEQLLGHKDELKALQDQYETDKLVQENLIEEQKHQFTASQQKVKELQDKLHEAEKDFKLLQGAKVDVDKSRKETEDVKALKKLVKSLEKSLSETESQNTSLQTEIRNIETGSRELVGRLEEKVRDLSQKLEAAERRNLRLQRKTSDVSSTECQTPEKEKEIAHDSELLVKVTKLETEASEQELKCQELTRKILRQEDYEIELDQLRENESLLKDEIDELKERLTSVDSSDVCTAMQMRELEKRLGNKLSVEDGLKVKISSLVEQIESGTVDLSNTQEQLQELLDSLQEDFTISADNQLRIFSEKLALEALVISKLATVVEHKNWLGENLDQKLYKDIFVVKHKMHLLEKAITSPVPTKELNTLPHEESSCVRILTDLLAEKMLLQSKFDSEFEKVSDDFTSATQSCPIVANMANVAWDKADLDNRLALQSSHMDNSSTSVPSKALIQSELAFTLRKMNDSEHHTVSGPENTNLRQEVLKSYRLIQKQHLQLTESQDSYKRGKVEELAKLHVLLSNTSDNAGLDRGLLETEMLHATQKLMEQQVSLIVEDLPTDSEAEVLGVISNTISEDTMLVVGEIVDAYERLSGKDVELDLDCSYSTETFPVSDADAVNRRRSSCLVKLAKVMCQRAVLAGLMVKISHEVKELESSKPKPQLRRSDSGLPTSPPGEYSLDDPVARGLASEAQQKSRLAQCLVKGDTTMDVKEEVHRLAVELASLSGRLDRSELIYGQLVQEAVSQAEKAYIRHSLHQKHTQQVTELQQVLESQHGASQVKYDSQIKGLEGEIAQLGRLLAENEQLMKKESSEVDEDIMRLEGELERREASHQQDVKARTEGYDIRIRSLQADVETSNNKLDAALQDKQTLITKYEDQIAELSGQLKEAREDLDQSLAEREAELAQYEMKMSDMQERIRKEGQAGHREDAQEIEHLQEELLRLRTMLDEQRSLHLTELSQLQGGTEDSEQLTVSALKIHQLQAQIQNMQGDYEHELALQRAAHRRELARCKEDLHQLIAAAETQTPHLNEENLRKRYLKDIEGVKELYDKGFVTMERSHQKIHMQLRQSHKQELEKLRQEKDQLLMEETKATQAALDAMRKAHEEELQKERNKFLDMIAKTYSQAELETLQTQHEDDMRLVQWELQQLTEQFSLRCLEGASLRERLDSQTRALHTARQRNQELLAKNEELTSSLKNEISKLRRISETDVFSDDSPDTAKLKVALRLREMEVKQLTDDMELTKIQLHEATCAGDEARAEYKSLHSQHTALSHQYQTKVQDLHQALAQLEAAATTAPRSEPPPLSPPGEWSMSQTDTSLDSSTPSRSLSLIEESSSERTPDPSVIKRAQWKQKRSLSWPGDDHDRQRALSNPAVPSLNAFSLPSLLSSSQHRPLTDLVESPRQPSEQEASNRQSSEQEISNTQPYEQETSNKQLSEQEASVRQTFEQEALNQQSFEQETSNRQLPPSEVSNKQPSLQEAPKRQPTTSGASKRQPSPQGASNRQPSPSEAPKRQPSPSDAPKIQPSPSEAPNRQPSPQGASNRQPSPHDSPKRQPSPREVPNRQSSEQEASNRQQLSKLDINSRISIDILEQI